MIKVITVLFITLHYTIHGLRFSIFTDIEIITPEDPTPIF